MKYQTDVNEVQALIMSQLLKRGPLRFSEINSEGLPSDQFSYHLRQMVKYGVVEKSKDNLYSLSVLGRSRSVLLDLHSNKFIEQGFVACRVLVSSEIKDKTHYLMQRRTRLPYKDYIGEPGGKILFSEDVAVAARRNMITETGLDCDMQVRGIAHFKDRYLNKVVQDKYFFIVRGTNPKGTLIIDGESGKNVWMTREEIASHPKVYQGVMEMIAISEGDGFGFIEENHDTDEY